MPSVPAPSLRLRLLGGTLAIVASIWIVLSLVAWSEAVHEAEELFDAHLMQTAALLAGMTGDEPGEIDEHLRTRGYMRKVIFQVWTNDGRLLARSPGAPAKRLSPDEQEFANILLDGRDWRVHSLRDPLRGHLVQVAEAGDARRAVSRELATHLLVPLTVALPLLAFGLIALIGRNLAPLTQLADSIGQRSPERLDAIPLAGIPRELHPLINRLNELFEHLGRSLEQERRFTADAAHELRTPLAAIRTHAQVAFSSRDDAERKHALNCVIEATDRTTHLVEQLLTLARLDAVSLTAGFSNCDLHRIAADTLAREAPHAFAKGIELSLTEEASPRLNVHVRGDATLLAILLRNLIDNAIRYSPGGSRIRMTLASTGNDGALIEIVDQGPGIPATERQRVTERFTRIAGSGETGSGLGLSIAARIVALHGARMELGDSPDGRGLFVHIAFPAPHEPEQPAP